MILVGDIGGTKTRLALFPSGASPGGFLREAVFASVAYADLESLVKEFLSSEPGYVEAAVFGVAGPVVDGKANLTNLPWVLDERRLAVTMGIPRVVLINDVVATAAAIPHLHEGEFLTLQQGKPSPAGNRAVIAPGTGLGEAFMIRQGDRWRVYATEGGHADYASRNEEEQFLWQDLQEERGHVSYEAVCAGPGIARIYRHLHRRYPQEEPLRGREVMAAGVADPVPVIVEEAMRPETACPLCARALRLYASVLAAEAGNLALKVMATAGVYLAGGIPPRILPFLREESFLRSFNNKGRMASLTTQMPVHVILEPRAALLGAAHWFREMKN